MRLAAIGLAAGSLAGCGGGSGGVSGGSGSPHSTGQVIASAAANVAPLVVDCGPNCSSNATVNEAFVTVTVCQPGSTTNCQTFDHIQVDTQSYGLRLLADATDTSGALLNTAHYPAEQPASGEILAECTVFADGYSFGEVATADVQISAESASGVPVQIIGSPSTLSVPTDCQSTGTAENTVSAFGGNGILGVGVFIHDCGAACAPGGSASPTYYYDCSTASGTCTDSTVVLTQQVSNPVVAFQTDNNGVVVELPPLTAAGASTVTGALVFGIDTEGNNGLGGATVFDAGSTGSIMTEFESQSLSDSILDTGSNAFYFDDSSLAQCQSSLVGFYCPTSTVSLSATISGASAATGGTSRNVNFSVANAQNLNGNFSAFDNLAGPITSGLQSAASGGIFDWGLPFFYGRNVFVAIENANTSGGTGPFFAF